MFKKITLALLTIILFASCASVNTVSKESSKSGESAIVGERRAIDKILDSFIREGYKKNNADTYTKREPENTFVLRIQDNIAFLSISTIGTSEKKEYIVYWNDKTSHYSLTPDC